MRCGRMVCAGCGSLGRRHLQGDGHVQVAHAPGSQPALAPPAVAAKQPEASLAPVAVTGVQAPEASAAGLQQKAQEQAPSAEFDMSQVLNLSGGSLPTSA